MKTGKATVWSALMAGNALMAAALAQEGFPLDGTWRGEFGPSSGDRTPVVIVMKWDGERINGMINPGPRSIEFTSAGLEPGTWTVRIEAQTPEAETIMIEGTLQDIGSYNRFIEGTWSQGGVETGFRIARE